jgi:SP family general alpha glucoside:H+ symporter-like MFS transporter
MVALKKVESCQSSDFRQVLGTYVVVAPAYASEVCPVALRGVLTSWINLSFVTGQLIANGVIAGTSRLDSHWAYSAPFAAQWVWPLIILILWPFAPESPWWLVRKGRIDEASHSLRRLASPKVDTTPTLAMIIETDKLEHAMEAGSSYMDCFKPVNLRRTEISIGVYTIQVLSGIYLVGYATYFFELAGLATTHAFAMGVGFLAVGFLGTLCSWVLLSYCGRRRIYNFGLAALVVILLIIGIIDCLPNYPNRPALAWTQSSLMLLWNFTYDLSVGPVCFVLICETSATRVRSKTIALATAVQATVAIGMTVAIPYLINPDQANGRGKIGFFFGGLSLLSLGWAWLRVPETKGRTYEELDLMFSRGVKTREFKNYRVE